MKISASVLKTKVSRAEAIKLLEQTDVDYIHVDIMDGVFVEATYGVAECLETYKNVNKPLDIHLMCQYPKEFINILSGLKPYYLTFHIEVEDDIEELIDLIHQYNIKAGIALNPETDPDKLKQYLGKIDYIIVMGVHPGAGGQALIPDVINKAKYYQYLKHLHNYPYEICLDGGVNAENRQNLNDLDVLTSGSYICMSDDYQAQINKLR